MVICPTHSGSRRVAASNSESWVILPGRMDFRRLPEGGGFDTGKSHVGYADRSQRASRTLQHHSCATPRATVSSHPMNLFEQDGQQASWFLISKPQAERRLCGLFSLFDVDAFYPTRTRTRHIQTLTGRKKVEEEYPIVPRYVFATIPGTPRWHVIRSIPFLSHAFGIDGAPVPISKEDVRRMARMRNSALEIERAAMEAATIKAGDKVRIIRGPLTDFVLNVDETDGKAATFTTDLGTLSVTLSNLIKVEP